MSEKKTFKPTHKIKIDDYGDYLDKVQRGTGKIKPKKGKDSYKRHRKHKGKDWE